MMLMTMVLGCGGPASDVRTSAAEPECPLDGDYDLDYDWDVPESFEGDACDDNEAQQGTWSGCYAGGEVCSTIETVDEKCAAILVGHYQCPPFPVFLELSGWTEDQNAGVPVHVSPPPVWEAEVARCVDGGGRKHDVFEWTFDSNWDVGTGFIESWSSTMTILFDPDSLQVESILADSGGVNVPLSAKFCCNPAGKNVSTVAWGPYPGEDNITCTGPGTYSYDWREL